MFPTASQEVKLWQSVGTARWVYNYTICMQRINYRFGQQFISDNGIRKHLTKMKKRPKYEWLNLVSNNVAKQAVKDACGAYRKWFNTLDGTSNLYVEMPKYKVRNKSRLSFYNDSTRLKIKGKSILLEKIGWVRTKEVLSNKNIVNPRISFDGKYWYIAVSYKIEKTVRSTNNHVLGIYLNGQYPIAFSTGEKYTSINESEKVKKIERRLCRIQKQLDRKLKIESNRKAYEQGKNVKKILSQRKLVYRKLSNIRENYWHQITSEIIKRNPDKIVLSSVCIKKLLSENNQSNAILKERFYEFKRQLYYKCERADILIVEVNMNSTADFCCSKCQTINFGIRGKNNRFIRLKCQESR
ncbi:transposase [uncultured Enterococcus sp.]|uniref:RNA-guided endonuclease InsQ/TnpB family protein n=1 Tax=uncultured Enterococcus sp. TaxID=167972 RepID=UPI002AA6EFC6|nr:transposase [uncultured Enterococcus sp.]